MKFKFDIKCIIVCFLVVFGMGFFLSFLMLCGLGTDPCSFMNKAVSLRIGILFGTWQLIVNVVMLIIVIFWDRSSLGFGTVFNMVLVGYYVDFFDWVWGKTIPANVFTDPVTRWPVFLGSLLFFEDVYPYDMGFLSHSNRNAGRRETRYRDHSHGDLSRSGDQPCRQTVFQQETACSR